MCCEYRITFPRGHFLQSWHFRLERRGCVFNVGIIPARRPCATGTSPGSECRGRYWPPNCTMFRHFCCTHVRKNSEAETAVLRHMVYIFAAEKDRAMTIRFRKKVCCHLTQHKQNLKKKDSTEHLFTICTDTNRNRQGFVESLEATQNFDRKTAHRTSIYNLYSCIQTLTRLRRSP